MSAREADTPPTLWYSQGRGDPFPNHLRQQIDWIGIVDEPVSQPSGNEAIGTALSDEHQLQKPGYVEDAIAGALRVSSTLPFDLWSPE